MIEQGTIIAEAGVNHNGSMKIAKKLIDSAKEAGANLVKFQIFKAETLGYKFSNPIIIDPNGLLVMD